MATADVQPRTPMPAPLPADAPPDPPGARRRRRGLPGRTTLLIGGLVVLLVAAALLSAGLGAFPIPPDEVIGAVLDRLGISNGATPDALAQSVLFEVRFPRIALGILVGAALGCAGALMQGVFGNPLAEPGVIGVSSGAAVGAVAVIVLGIAPFGGWTVMVAAFLGGLLTTMLVYAAARNGGRTEVVTLVLTGIAVNAIAGALIGLLSFVADDAELRSVTFWNLGSVTAATWPVVAVVTPAAVVGLLLAPALARQLDLLSLGEAPARHLGVDVERLRLAAIGLVALLTASAVAVAGVITFLGLVVPHLIRLIAGPGHRVLVPASALAGAVVLVAGDLAARTIAAPAEIPLGVLTALIGAPVFLSLLRRTRARQGGWA